VNAVSTALSTTGRLTRRPFAIGVIAVYFLGSASQVLLTQPILARAGIWPFALLHAVLLWVWFVLHANRLRDAGRGTGSALGVAIVNALSVLLLLMVIALFATPEPGGESTGSVLGTWVVIIFFLAVISGTPALGLFAIVVWAIIVIAMAPVLLALGFSIWAGTRPSAPVTPL
jgi:uncharacterized membrane protein YhaH (DUF805 family)